MSTSPVRREGTAFARLNPPMSDLAGRIDTDDAKPTVPEDAAPRVGAAFAKINPPVNPGKAIPGGDGKVVTL